MARQLKNFMKAKKRWRCKCLTISRRRSWDFCHCAESSDFYIYWITQTFTVDWEQRRIFANGSYIAVTNDNWTEIFFTTESWVSDLPDDATYALVIINEDNYNILKALTDRLSEASDESWVDAVTKVSAEELHVIKSNIDRSKWTVVKLVKEDDNLVGIYDYTVKNKLGEVTIEDDKYYIDGKEIFIMDTEEGDAIKDYFEKVFVEWVENIPVDYQLSWTFRNIVKAKVVDSIESVDEDTLRVTDKDGVWVYDLKINSDSVTVYVVEDDSEIIGEFDLDFADVEDLLDYIPFMFITKDFNDMVIERIENDDFIHNS